MQYICWNDKRMPEFKFLVKEALGTDYYLYNGADDAYLGAAELAVESGSTVVIIQRAIDGDGEWKSKIIADVYPPDPDPIFDFGASISERDRPEFTVHFSWWCEAGDWLNPPEDWVPCEEYCEWYERAFGHPWGERN